VTAADASPVAPEEAIAAAMAELRRAVEEDLLTRLLQVTPAAFERLVLTLLKRLGYGGAVDSDQVLGRSGDGGVDGVIREDALGLDMVYVQAKRWQGSVGSPTVLEFAGALSAHRARKGVIITTSTFTREAIATADRVDARIVLIDGATLARYMYDTGLGLTTVDTYEIKRIDSEFFEE
jgi:restriction system protein